MMVPMYISLRLHTSHVNSLKLAMVRSIYIVKIGKNCKLGLPTPT